MGTTEIIRSVVSVEMQWNGFFSEFALIDASVIVPVMQEEKNTIPGIIDPVIFL